MASVLLMVAGGFCVMAGYMLCAWRQHAQRQADMTQEDLDSHERVMEMIESMIDEEGRRRDHRPN